MPEVVHSPFAAEALRHVDARLEAEACLRLALPPSQWEMWGDETDRAIILAHLGNEELRCPGCGGYLDETTDRSLVNRVHEDLVCHRCAAMATHRAHREERHAPLLPGTLLWAESIRPDPPTDN